MYKGNSVQRKRLQRFSKFLRNLPTEHFDISCVVQSKETDPTKINLKSCGTAACAIGHLVVFNPWRFEYSPGPNFTEFNQFIIKDKVTHNDDWGELVKDYFGIHDKYIFHQNGYETKNGWPMSAVDITPQMVADKIDHLLSSKDDDEE